MAASEKPNSSARWALGAGIPALVAVFLYYMFIGQGDSIVDLPAVTIKQGTIVGRTVNYDTFPKPLEGFMGIPYAVPPVGQQRFLPAAPVPAGNSTLKAFYLGARCPGEQLVPFLKDDVLGPDYESEDCLTINIWRPQNHTASNKRLPVTVMIPGGAFNRGAARMHNTHTMLANSPEPFIAVSMQYRIGVFGGLNTGLTEKEGLLNLGLKDMYVALEWVQDNIAAFGGNPNDVTIMGLSAAAHGIGHLIMDINQPKKLFHKAIMDSGAHTARAVHLPTADLHTQHFREFLDLTPCSNFTDLLDTNILTCLRNLPSDVIDLAGKEVFRRSNPSVRWAWQPVIDGQVISRRPIHAWKSGKWQKVPILTGSTHNEGSYYVSPKTNKSSEFTGFFKTLLPHLSESDVAELERLYPDPDLDPTSPYKDTSGLPDVGSQFRRLEAAYGQYAYTCPVRQTVHWATFHNKSDPPVFLYHWAVNQTALHGANHGNQIRYQTYNPEVRSISPSQDEIAGNFHAYCVSFILYGDPNKMSQGKFSQRPEWPRFQNGKGLTMLLGDGNDERAGGKGTGIAAQAVEYKWGQNECNFWWRISEKWEE
ncbi:Carboxylesterase family [Geosmithia morbida]|uniref:Carboxylesterase family n=1 Tax=Geosmithia morbida TaxID=1094350 RepID=A0A9P5CXL6_9HYPO|nr:Carboxylesterase family [Geosmithia morbida]KAF4119418.1 Carboxylesterase family [Geosmithia morbida]